MGGEGALYVEDGVAEAVADAKGAFEVGTALPEEHVEVALGVVVGGFGGEELVEGVYMMATDVSEVDEHLHGDIEGIERLDVVVGMG